MVYRNTRFACPGCGQAIAADTAIAWCNGCEGVWVSEAELVERVRFVRGMNEFNLELVFGPAYPSGSTPARRACPLCSEQLDHASLGEAEIDRCSRKHGIWFDAGELESVLGAATRGVAVMIPAVALGPGERVALEQIQVESSQVASSASSASSSSWDAGDGFDVIALLADLVASLLD